MDCPVRQKQKDLIAHFLLSSSTDMIQKLFKKWCKESRSSKTDIWQGFSVNIDDARDSLNLRVLHISIDWETVTNPIRSHVPWNSSKAINWEWSVEIIRFNNATNIEKCLLILIVAASKIVQCAWLRWVPIRSGIVNSSNYWDSPTSSKIIWEIWLLDQFPFW